MGFGNIFWTMVGGGDSSGLDNFSEIFILWDA